MAQAVVCSEPARLQRASACTGQWCPSHRVICHCSAGPREPSAPALCHEDARAHCSMEDFPASVSTCHSTNLGTVLAPRHPWGCREVLSPCACAGGDGASEAGGCLRGQVAGGRAGCWQPPNMVCGRHWGCGVKTTPIFTRPSAPSGLQPAMGQGRQLRHQFPCSAGSVVGLGRAGQSGVQKWGFGLGCEPRGLSCVGRRRRVEPPQPSSHCILRP